MDVINSVGQLQSRLAGEETIALVPTMGNLHAGHIALVADAKKRAKCVVASIFVNRLQFEPGGDFERYPRTLADDRARLRSAGCDVVFVPDEDELYPEPQEMLITPPKAAEQLCGSFRPGHFQGVVTVVAKLFNIVGPQVAVFGKKDYQQLFVIRQLVRQLSFPIEIVGGETVREPDGLAMSSRNGYLTTMERGQAVRLSRNLRAIAEAVRGGSRDFAKLTAAACADLESDGWRVDYFELRERDSLTPPTKDDRELVVLGAAWLGRTRLIDNFEI